jgi:peroxiredoxin
VVACLTPVGAAYERDTVGAVRRIATAGSCFLDARMPASRARTSSVVAERRGFDESTGPYGLLFVAMTEARRYLNFELLTPKGTPVFVKDVLAKAPTVACFVRHFGCIFCFEHAADAVQQRHEIERRGAQLIIIGNGNPAHAREFERETGLEGAVFTDPSRQFYRELAMRHGVGRVLNLQAPRNARRAFLAGFRQVGVKGDRWQLGGNVVFAKDGALLYADHAEAAGDLTPVAKALLALG